MDCLPAVDADVVAGSVPGELAAGAAGVGEGGRPPPWARGWPQPWGPAHPLGHFLAYRCAGPPWSDVDPAWVLAEILEKFFGCHYRLTLADASPRPA